MSLADGPQSAVIFPLCFISRAAGLPPAIPAAAQPIALLLIPLLQDAIPVMFNKILSVLTEKIVFQPQFHTDGLINPWGNFL